jgi:hypothetical protein
MKNWKQNPAKEIEVMKNYKGNPVKLVDATTGKEVKPGDEITTFRGEVDIYRYAQPPHKESASGKVNDYYASVYNLKFVKI